MKLISKFTPQSAWKMCNPCQVLVPAVSPNHRKPLPSAWPWGVWKSLFFLVNVSKQAGLSPLHLFGLILAYFNEDRVCMWKQTERISERHTWTPVLHCWGNTPLCSELLHRNTVNGIHLCKFHLQLQERFGGVQFIANSF